MIPDAEARPATVQDAGVIATLLGELGYEADPVAVRRWLEQHEGSETDGVLVIAEGWMVLGVAGVQVVELLPELTKQGRITALVVTGHRRGGGVGHRLLWSAERWLRERGCTHVELVSSLGPHREAAHAFYPAEGYERSDRAVYRKALTD